MKRIAGTVLTGGDWTAQFFAKATFDGSSRLKILLDAITAGTVLDNLNPASSIGTLADVTAAASATQLTSSSTACKAVLVVSLAANTGKIRVGDSNVSASRGAELSAGDAVVLMVSNVNLVYVFGNASDKVSVTYVN